jgi:hypothetical protein
MLFLCLARFLIIALPMRFWRRSLGSIVETKSDDITQASTGDLDIQAVAAAVKRGARCLPLRLACLPRAMAMQWMLTRRGCASRLVFAVTARKALGRHMLHAWVEAGGEIVIGEDPATDFQPNLTLQSRF